MAAGVRAALVALILLWPAALVAQCRQALLLALDVSGSVDAREYRLQLDGLAAALMTPQVVAAFEAMPGAPVRLSIIEWSGPDFQRVVQPWADIRSVADLAAVAGRLQATQRVAADHSTAIGAALMRGAAMLRAQAECWRRVMDVSGDGKSNTGPLPHSVRVDDGITVNGLVIGEAVPTAGEGRAPQLAELSAYYRAYVLRGEDAFLETAQGFEDFHAAMARKLLRELQVVAVSEAR